MRERGIKGGGKRGKEEKENDREKSTFPVLNKQKDGRRRGGEEDRERG